MLSAYPGRAHVTKFDGAREACRAKPATASELERLEAREQTWRGAPEWAIREEMERALERRRRRAAMAVARAARRTAA